MRGARKTGAAHALQKGEIAVTTKKRYWAGTSAKLSAWAGTKSALWAGVGGGDGVWGEGLPALGYRGRVCLGKKTLVQIQSWIAACGRTHRA